MSGLTSSLKVSDPVFTLKLAAGYTTGGLFDALDAALAGELIDFPAMQAHQRAPVVTVLAVIAHTLRRYGSGGLEEEWDCQIGTDALRIAAPHDEQAFLQPPTGEPTKPQSIESLDCLLPRVQHEVKETFRGSVEEWLFALMGGQARPNVNFNRSSSRFGMTAVLPSVDGTIGGEIRSLIQAYDSMFKDGTGPASKHMLWLLRLDRNSPPLIAGDLPRPILDAGRPVRLRFAGEEVEARLFPTNALRISNPGQWMDDPHTAGFFTSKSVDRFRLAAKPWDHSIQHQILFGGKRGQDEVERPAILHSVDYRFVRICALGTDQGKTRGYHEELYAASRSAQTFRLEPPEPGDRAADLSARALDALSTGNNQLSVALRRVLQVDSFKQLKYRPMERATISDAERRFTSLAGSASIQVVLDLLSQEPDLESEQRRIHDLIAPLVWRVFTEVRSAQHDPLSVAAGEDYLRGKIIQYFGIDAMQASEDIPQLARQSHAALAEIVAHLTPGDRATLRTMPLGEPPIEFWTHLAVAPADHSVSRSAIEVWIVVLRTVGSLRHSRRPVGAVLADTEFPKDRVSRLLTATGGALTGAIDEVGRWLMSHDVDNADLSALLALGLADALCDVTTTDWSRRRIAVEYARRTRRKKAATLKEAS